MKIKLFKQARNLGFTMIELLIVISILGILAVAVLSAINPIEQINRGRDTGTRSDAEQFLGAIERYNAVQGYYPWDLKDDEATGIATTTLINSEWMDTEDCAILDKLASGTDTCVGTNEVKETFSNRVDGMGDVKGLYVYKEDGTSGTTLYICFTPQSESFTREAQDRCDDTDPAPPDDFPAEGCAVDETPMICLP